MTAFGDYFEDAILNWFRGTTFPAATGSVHAALYTSATDDTNAGGTEVSGNAYARQAITKATGSWGAPSGGAISNTNEIAFPAATPSAWGTVTHMALQDASSVGNRVVHGALTASKAVNAGDVFRFAPGSLSVTVA